jgi:hypothetical protein
MTSWHSHEAASSFFRFSMRIRAYRFEINPARWSVRNTTVTVGRCTPSITAGNSCFRGNRRHRLDHVSAGASDNTAA